MDPLKLQSNVFGPVIQEYRVWSAASLLRPPWTTEASVPSLNMSRERISLFSCDVSLITVKI